MGYAEEVGGLGEVAVGMGYGGCDFVFLVACFEFELNVCAGIRRIKIQFFRGDDPATGFQHCDTDNVFQFPDVARP